MKIIFLYESMRKSNTKREEATENACPTSFFENIKGSQGGQVGFSLDFHPSGLGIDSG